MTSINETVAVAAALSATPAAGAGVASQEESHHHTPKVKVEVPPVASVRLLRSLLSHYKACRFYLDANKKTLLAPSRVRGLHGLAAEKVLTGQSLATRQASRDSAVNQVEGTTCARDDCWCRSLVALKGSLAISLSPGSSVATFQDIYEEAQREAHLLRTGPQDQFTLREGLLSRAVLHCEFEVASGSLEVWPSSEALTDPADEILAQEHRAHVQRKLVESVRPEMEAAAKKAAAGPPEQASEERAAAPAPPQAKRDEAADARRAEHFQAKAADEQRRHFVFASSPDSGKLRSFEEAVKAVLRGPAGRELEGVGVKEPRRSGEAACGSPGYAELLLQQLLFLLWGPADATFTDEVLACRPSVWRSRLAACGACTTVKTMCCGARACREQGCCDCCIRKRIQVKELKTPGVGDAPSGGAASAGEHATGSVLKSNLEARHAEMEQNGLEFFDCTCSRFRSSVIPIVDNEVAGYLDEDSLLLPEDPSAKNRRKGSSEGGGEGEGKAADRLVKYTFAVSQSGESDSDDSWNYEPSSTSSSDDEDDDQTEYAAGGVSPLTPNQLMDLPASAPRRRLHQVAMPGTPTASSDRTHGETSFVGCAEQRGKETKALRGATRGARKSCQRASALNTADSVRHLGKQIDRAIELLGGSCVPFLNSVCPTDAHWMVSGAAFTNRTSAFGAATFSVSTSSSSMAFSCSESWEVLLLLKSSQRVSDTLARPLHGCVDLLLEEPASRSCTMNTHAAARAYDAEPQGRGRADADSRSHATTTWTCECPAHAIRDYSRRHVALPLWTQENASGSVHASPRDSTSAQQPADDGDCATREQHEEKEGSCRVEATGERSGCGSASPRSALNWWQRVTVRDELSLVETKRLEEGMEFRCFVGGGKVLGITQRFLQDYFPFLVKKRQLQEKVRRAIVSFVERVVVGAEGSEGVEGKDTRPPFLRRFVLDVYVQRKKKRDEETTEAEEPSCCFKCWILNVLPWGGKTDSLLFTWEELRTIAYTLGEPEDCAAEAGTGSGGLQAATRDTGTGVEGRMPQLRVIEHQGDADSSLRDGALQLPKELQDIASVAGAGGMQRGGPSLEDLLHDLQAAHSDALRSQKKHAAQAEKKK
ncbi:hypothetical protein BESB_010600 [Besnoitia besnoiti]|uniref:Uncharacterized protein n=1 Tax=Besnoitia besnoiti TaxID=94643 RepID=A0A2A9MJJ6_BESBE|nr:hypothetical protein BESB_010600 [Besnoitia besnoiti]PFH38718.1 hypothetical protein BESB_010600 [Besnoitia besnoiti]